MNFRKIKKSAAVLLSFCMTLTATMLPGTPVALAATGDTIEPVVYSTDEFSESLLADHNGYVVKYSETSGLICLDVNLWNVPTMNATGLYIKFDPAVVKVSNSAGGNAVLGTLPNKIKETMSTIPDDMIQPESVADVSGTGFSDLTNVLVTGTDFNAGYLAIVANATAGFEEAWGSALKDVTSGGFTVYPKDTLVPFYKIYFKTLEGQAVTSDTFQLLEWDGSTTGAKFMLSNQVADGVVFVGFPEPTAPTYSVAVHVGKNNSSDWTTEGTNFIPLSGATVVINGVTYTTSSDGELLNSESTLVPAISMEAGTYNYTVTPAEGDQSTEQEQTGTFEVTAVAEQNITLKSAKYTAPSHAFQIEVLDGDDNNNPLTGATVTLDGNSQTTDASGIVSYTKQESSSSYALKITKTGYGDNTGATVKVNAGGSLAVTGDSISAEGTKVSVVLYKTKKLITVPVLDSENNPISGAVVTVNADPEGSVPSTIVGQLPKTFTADEAGNAVLNLPAGDYLITVGAAGYESSGAMKVKVEETQVTVAGGTPVGLTDNAATVTLPESEKLTAVNGPLYTVTGTWDDETNPTYMDVTVNLQNVNATTGTFGLRYDTNLFTLADGNFTANTKKIKLATDLKNPETNGTLTNPLHDTAYGYHLFTWSGIPDGGGLPGTVDASVSEVPLATYRLTVKDGVDAAALMNNESLFVIPLEDTDYQTMAENAYGDNTDLIQEFTEQFWRPVDGKNIPAEDGSLPAGRLDQEQAVGGGFYQVFPVGSGAVAGFDIRSQFVFPNPNHNIRVEFAVTDDATGLPIKDAVVTVFDEHGYTEDPEKIVATLTTNDRGEIYTSKPQNTNYTYYVNKTGYWPYPGKTVEADAHKTEAIAVQEATVSKALTLQAKTYHPVALFIGQEASPDTAATVTMAGLSGEGIAYNGVSYLFNILPKAGYEWAKEKPATLSAVITKGNAATNADTTVTATFDKKANAYKIDGAAITGNPLGEENKPDTPLDESLKAGDMTIKLTDDYFKQAQFIITATAGAGGAVTSEPTADSSADDGIVGDTTQIVQTLDEGVTTSAKFIFTPNAAGEGKTGVIDKVVINGVSVTGVKGLENYDYTFENVLSNQAMTVTFGVKDNETGEITPASAPVVTVVGSEFGTVTVGEKTIGAGERMDFTIGKTGNSYDNFTATVTPVAGSDPEYVVDRVLVEGVETALTGDALTLTDFRDGEHRTVVVTFKTKDGPSIQAVVVSSVGAGEGTVSPMGVSVYNLNDTPEYKLKPSNDKYQLGNVVLGGSSVEGDKIPAEEGVATYKLPALTGDTTLVGNFDEVTYAVNLLVQFGKTATVTPNHKAEITFTRQSDNKVLTFPTDTPAEGVASTVAKVPVGTWTVTVHKNGFLDVIVTDFTIDGTETEAVNFGELNTDGVVSARPVLLVIGEANRDGRLIALNDVAQVANGLLTTSSAASQEWADLDDNGQAKVEDMGYVKANFGQYYSKLTYDAFCTPTE